MKKRFFGNLVLVGALALFSSVARAEEGTADEHNFEGGMMLQLGKPGLFKPNSGGVTSNGFGVGYGFLLGWRAMQYLTVNVGIDALAHSIVTPAPSVLRDSVQVSASLSTKVFPLGNAGPRVYALLGIAFTRYIASENLGLFQFNDDNIASVAFKGHSYTLGAGYQHEIQERVSIFGELAFVHTILTKQTFRSAQPVALNPHADRWAPLFRFGILASF